MFGRGICEKYQSRDEKFPEPNGEGNLDSRLVFFANIYEIKQSRDEKFPESNGEGNLVSRLVFFANTPPKHDISV